MSCISILLMKQNTMKEFISAGLNN